MLFWDLYIISLKLAGSIKKIISQIRQLHDLTIKNKIQKLSMMYPSKNQYADDTELMELMCESETDLVEPTCDDETKLMELMCED